MGCGSSKTHRNGQHPASYQRHHHHEYPVDKKAQKKYQKAYIKQAKRDRRKKDAAVNMSVANTAFVGYVFEPIHECKISRKTRPDGFRQRWWVLDLL
jgi:hypothetical protein